VILYDYAQSKADLDTDRLKVKLTITVSNSWTVGRIGIVITSIPPRCLLLKVSVSSPVTLSTIRNLVVT
jgi:hypothetical protein